MKVEIADTEAARARGLMFRKMLAPDRGMLFLFEERGVHPLWMKNTLISLDIMWLDSGGTIISIPHAVPPALPSRAHTTLRMPKRARSWRVISGFARQNDVKVGDSVKFEGSRRPLRCR